MKKLLAILVGVAVVAAYVPCFAAMMLNDDQMANMYAGDSYTINDVWAISSAVGAQSNIAAVVSGGDQVNIIIDNDNDLSSGGVYNVGDSAVGLQSNIAALYSIAGAIDGADISNDNDAYVENDNDTDDGGVTASSLAYTSYYYDLAINHVIANQSAVAAQSNIAAIGADAGGVYNTTISNLNYAYVDNYY